MLFQKSWKVSRPNQKKVSKNILKISFMRNLVFGLVACLISLSGNAQVKNPDVIAVGILDRMSDVVGELSSVGFTLKTRVDEQNQDLGLVTNFAINQVYFNGPSQMLIRTDGTKGKQGYWYNGQQLAYYSFNENNYVIIETPETTIEMIAEVNDRYGVDFPAADFFNPTFTDDILQNFDEVSFAGLQKIEGKDCFYIIVRRKDMSVQLWLANDAYMLPVKMIIMYLSSSEPKQYEASFSDWEINPFLPDVMFNFQPPPMAREILIKPIK
jgi:hypothetical protein